MSYSPRIPHSPITSPTTPRNPSFPSTDSLRLAQSILPAERAALPQAKVNVKRLLAKPAGGSADLTHCVPPSAPSPRSEAIANWGCGVSTPAADGRSKSLGRVGGGSRRPTTADGVLVRREGGWTEAWSRSGGRPRRSSSVSVSERPRPPIPAPLLDPAAASSTRLPRTSSHSSPPSPPPARTPSPDSTLPYLSTASPPVFPTSVSFPVPAANGTALHTLRRKASGKIKRVKNIVAGSGSPRQLQTVDHFATTRANGSNSTLPSISSSASDPAFGTSTTSSHEHQSTSAHPSVPHVSSLRASSTPAHRPGTGTSSLLTPPSSEHRSQQLRTPMAVDIAAELVSAASSPVSRKTHARKESTGFFALLKRKSLGALRDRAKQQSVQYDAPPLPPPPPPMPDVSASPGPVDSNKLRRKRAGTVGSTGSKGNRSWERESTPPVPPPPPSVHQQPRAVTDPMTLRRKPSLSAWVTGGRSASSSKLAAAAAQQPSSPIATTGRRPSTPLSVVISTSPPTSFQSSSFFSRPSLSQPSPPSSLGSFADLGFSGAPPADDVASRAAGVGQPIVAPEDLFQRMQDSSAPPTLPPMSFPSDPTFNDFLASSLPAPPRGARHHRISGSSASASGHPSEAEPSTGGGLTLPPTLRYSTHSTSPLHHSASLRRWGTAEREATAAREVGREDHDASRRSSTTLTSTATATCPAPSTPESRQQRIRRSISHPLLSVIGLDSLSLSSGPKSPPLETASSSPSPSTPEWASASSRPHSFKRASLTHSIDTSTTGSARSRLSQRMAFSGSTSSSASRSSSGGGMRGKRPALRGASAGRWEDLFSPPSPPAGEVLGHRPSASVGGSAGAALGRGTRSEEDKERAWEALMEKTERSGGTLHVHITPTVVEGRGRQ